ncbi:integrin alpha-M-like [Megalops cyprinoides]|uniref:integrin alpha-M-like n=1 Tax=Megalops cyprinoides TaxID=118141 RepID=UPI0018646F7B|nr:integrin alpha-M-like [Megalops cyprinoides]
MDWILTLTLCLCTVSQPAVTFNVDPVAWKSFINPATAFGYRVIQTKADRLLVSAPLNYYTQNRKGTVYDCSVGSSTCSQISIQVPNHGVNMSLGLSMSKDPKSSKTLVCGPTIPRQCPSITTYNGMCFQLSESFSVSKSGLPPNLRACPKGTDIVFLMDGSGSVSDNDFAQMKSFVINMISQLLGRNSQFAVMQYSSDFEIHFDFNQFKRNSNAWRGSIAAIRQQKGVTRTATAIRTVVRELFGSTRGARPEANKVLLVITDGVTYLDPLSLHDVIPEAELKGIIRYAIGVGQSFNPNSQGRAELETIASKPTVNHLFPVSSFQALDKLRDTLQKNIFAIEGTQTGESFDMELAQEGFSSALLSSGAILMGTVGAKGWQGGYQKFPSNRGSPAFDSSSKNESDSYLGFSMAIAELTDKETHILGAPRYKHIGKVVVFFSSGKQFEIEGEQIGSYFGAEVCTVDLNSDSKTDLLLIAAPMYRDTQKDTEGKVIVCTFENGPSVSCTQDALVGEPGERGKFGSCVSALADLNGDGISDVAVGAPLEGNGQGSLYIFSGNRRGVNSIYSQRIQSSSIKKGLQYFGQSVSGSLDQSEDMLPDIAVGSKGEVLLLRSRPVVSVGLTVSYSPSKIPTGSSECTKIPITATVCFTMQKLTRDKIAVKAQISYALTLDATRSRFRAHFSSNNRTQEKVILIKQQHCNEEKFFIAECPEDALNPLSNEIKFHFYGLASEDKYGLAPVLDQQSTTTYHPLDFEIDCGTDNKCVDDLKVDFNFSGASEVQVGIALVLNVTVFMENRAENSYSTHVNFTYPAGLSYRRVTVVQDPSRRTTVQCSASDSEDRTTPGKSVCFINRPIFRSNTRALFIISFGIDGNSHYDRSVTFTANATSGNELHSGSENFKMDKINVKYNIYMLIKGLDDTTSYINFTAGKNDLTRPVLHSFEVVNYIRDLNATVIFKVPIKLGGKNIWSDANRLQIPGCQIERDEKPKVNNFVEVLKNKPTVDCTVSVCRVIKCSVYLRKDGHYSYNFSGEVSSGWIEQTQLTSLHLVSRAVFDYDRNQFIYTASSSQNNPPVTEVATRVEVYTEADFTKEIIGSAMGGLLLLALITAGLYKAGFFKSRYKQKMENTEDGAGEADAASGEDGTATPASE